MRAAVRWMLLGALVLLVAAVAWTGVALVQARDDLVAARELLSSLDGEEPSSASPVLGQAQVRFERAAARLDQPGPRAVAAVPLVGRTVEAVAAVAQTGAAVAAGGRDVLDAVPADLVEEGRLDLAAAREVEEALRRAARDTEEPVRRLREVELTGTPDVVAAGARAARERTAEVPRSLRRGADTLAALRAVLGEQRERRVLVVLQNNAELRAGGGLVSVFAQATARDGKLTLGGFQEVEAVADPPQTARRVPAPADFAREYGPFKADTTLWRNVNMAADVPMSSTVLAEVAAATLPTRPDAILWVDVPAMAAVLRATGPVTLHDGSELTADNAVVRLLSEAYARRPGEQERRRDELRAAGDAVIAQLLSRSGAAATTALARELAAAAAGRHLSLWSAVASEQELLLRAGLAGAARAGGGDLSAFTVHNLGGGEDFGNKLDFYSRRQVTVRVEVGQGAAVVEQELAVRNTAPAAGLPEYVAGRARPGRLNQFVTAALPAGAQDVVLSRDRRVLEVTPAPMLDHLVVHDVAGLPPGQTMTWRLRYRLPLEGGSYSLRLVPQPLAVDAGLLVEVEPAVGTALSGGGARRSGPFDETVELAVEVDRPGTWERLRAALRRFWNEPVPLP